MLRKIIYLAVFSLVIAQLCAEGTKVDAGAQTSHMDPDPPAPVNVFRKPIMYGTAIGFVVILAMIIGFIYSMGEEKDPLIFSKFLTVRKKNN